MEARKAEPAAFVQIGMTPRYAELVSRLRRLGRVYQERAPEFAAATIFTAFGCYFDLHHYPNCASQMDGRQS
jgi:hypothetical protein